MAEVFDRHHPWRAAGDFDDCDGTDGTDGIARPDPPADVADRTQRPPASRAVLRPGGAARAEPGRSRVVALPDPRDIEGAALAAAPGHDPDSPAARPPAALGATTGGGLRSLVSPQAAIAAAGALVLGLGGVFLVTRGSPEPVVEQVPTTRIESAPPDPIASTPSPSSVGSAVMPTAQPTALPAAEGASQLAASPPTGTISVHVVGQVRRPGVVQVPVGARVVDALQAAGGSTDRADLTRLNLARQVSDGEQVAVPRPGEPVTAGPSGASSPAGASGQVSAEGPAGTSGTPAMVNLNTADEQQLDTLPGVGPVLAGRIVQWRQEHGSFAQVDDLAEVAGIGTATLTRLRPLVTV